LAAELWVSHHLGMRHRLNVTVDERLWFQLEQEAARRGVPVAKLVCEALDERFPGHVASRRGALQALLDVELTDVPEPAELRDELDAMRGRGAT
jgi:predicted DNA-binding ribbon-helix-helix protein